jgi:hypothetical protein
MLNPFGAKVPSQLISYFDSRGVSFQKQKIHQAKVPTLATFPQAVE